MTLKPKKENKNVGFKYSVTHEQIKKHQSLSVEEIFQWIYEMNVFFYETQTDEERNRQYIFKPNKKPIKGLDKRA